MSAEIKCIIGGHTCSLGECLAAHQNGAKKQPCENRVIYLARRIVEERKSPKLVLNQHQTFMNWLPYIKSLTAIYFGIDAKKFGMAVDAQVEYLETLSESGRKGAQGSGEDKT